MPKISLTDASNIRDRWIDELSKGSFAETTARIEAKLEAELAQDTTNLRIHLGTCSVIPEEYQHDSTEEKIYSKYTDHVLAVTFRFLGLEAAVVETRADSADVTAHHSDFSMVADAKAFRLSRTAKNQKDFKVSAMKHWQGNADHALIVIPLYQAPALNSQIYRQAVIDNIAIASYAHMIALIELQNTEKDAGTRALKNLLEVPQSLPASKTAQPYWAAARNAITNAHKTGREVWKNVIDEAKALLTVAKHREIRHINQRELEILNLSHAEAIARITKCEKLPQRRLTIEAIGPTKTFEY